MNNQNVKIDLIEKFLEDQLNPAEKAKFEQELLNNHELKEEIRQHQLMIDGIKLHGRTALLNKTKEWDEELGEVVLNEPNEMHIKSFRWYYLAAAISLILVSVAVIYSNLNDGFERVVAAHYEPYTYIPDTQRGETGKSQLIDDLFQYYDHGEYAQVISLINEMDAKDKTDLFNFLQGNAFQATGQNDKAISVFSELANSNSMYSLGAKWYLALCYLSESEPEKAIPLIEELRTSNSSFTPKSEQLLKDLE